ncbi:hypothetical protein [Bosea sp. BH3]|uniref:hypothetical protein n=1 Tax=Bosea sp. BH3 TaxID=2871701 RepID=UPI0021CB39CE|nr:hypothetical protein [Bosea sp. BH3]MCU4180417.1 hypothetical protein [Bosea sp. BH3]
MIVESWTLAAAAEALQKCGSMLGLPLAIPAVKDWANGCLKRGMIGRSRPVNHDLVRGIRTAHLGAVRAVLDDHRRLVDAVDAMGQHARDEERSFNSSVKAFLDERLKVFDANTLREDALTFDDIDRVLGHVIDPRTEALYDQPDNRDGLKARLLEDSRRARAEAVERALAEIQATTGRPCPDLFGSVFRGDHGCGWYDVFALYIAEEIKTNPRFQAIFFAAEFVDLKRAVAGIDDEIKKALAVFPQLQDAQNEIRSSLGRVEGLLRSIHESICLNQMRGLTWPRIDKAELGHAGADPQHMRFSFKFAIDELQGRAKDFAEVEAVLFGESASSDGGIRRSFRWHAICGDGGSGKSRFAMELLERHRQRWPASGFVQAFAIDGKGAALWPVGEHPAILVIDYAAAHPGTMEFLEGLAIRAQNHELKSPVRVVLIERNANDPLFSKLKGAAAHECLRIAAPQNIHRLAALSDKDLVRLMRNRAADAPVAQSDSELLEVLREYDKACRPLFAAIVADFLFARMLPEVDQDATAEDKRLALFSTLIEREREIWLDRLAASRGDRLAAEESRDQHERLVAAATLVRGLDRRAFHNLSTAGKTSYDLGAAHWPRPVDEALYQSITGSSGGAGQLAPLVPDLIGERLVLDLLAPAGDRPVDPLIWADRADWLRQTAWILSPWDVAFFARLCFQDYPRTTAALDYLLPAAGTLDPVVISALVRGLIVDMAEARKDETPSQEDLEAAFAVYDRFESQLLAAAPGNEAVARNLAASLQQLANFAGRAVNKHINYEYADHDAKLRAMSAGSDPTTDRKGGATSLSGSFDSAQGQP